MKRERLNERTRKRYYYDEGRNYTYNYYFRAFFRRIRHEDSRAKEDNYVFYNFCAYISVITSIITTLLFALAIIYYFYIGLDNILKVENPFKFGLFFEPTLLLIWMFTTLFALASDHYKLAIVFSIIRIAVVMTLLTMVVAAIDQSFLDVFGLWAAFACLFSAVIIFLTKIKNDPEP